MTNVNPLSDREIENRKAACETFVEQTKQLISLASVFVFAPAVAEALLNLGINFWLVFAEIAFIISVLSSYFVLGSVAGSQRKGEFDVYRPATMRFGQVQFFSYVIGLIFFFLWLILRPTPTVP
jgi:hypothetical protein